jgi:uncharacterized protein YggE
MQAQDGAAMERQPVISVRGEAWLEVDPEIAVVTVSAAARDRDRRSVLDRLAARNRDVLDLARGYGDAVEKVESGPVSAYPEMKKGERGARYAGQAQTQITVRDFSVLGELVAKLAELEMVSVTGPWWSLRPDSPVRRQARIAAARDATRRAGEYAEAFSGQLGELIEAADTGLLSQHEHAVAAGAAGSFMARSRGMARGTAAADETPQLDLEPVRQTVTANVDARFTMVVPATGG